MATAPATPPLPVARTRPRLRHQPDLVPGRRLVHDPVAGVNAAAHSVPSHLRSRLHDFRYPAVHRWPARADSRAVAKSCCGSALPPRAEIFAAGLGLALASMLLVVAAMTVAEVFTPFFRLTRSVAIGRVASAAAAGIFAGVFEEIFFRGILFMGLRAHSYKVRAYLLANLFYAALHFVRPGEAYFLDRLDLSAGYPSLGVHLHAISRPAVITARPDRTATRRRRTIICRGARRQFVSRHRLARRMGV